MFRPSGGIDLASFSSSFKTLSASGVIGADDLVRLLMVVDSTCPFFHRLQSRGEKMSEAELAKSLSQLLGDAAGLTDMSSGPMDADKFVKEVLGFL